MTWKINTAMHIGRDHELSMRNRQDFLLTHRTETRICGIVCDGCSESTYSELGAMLLGNFILSRLKTMDIWDSPYSIKMILETAHYNFIDLLNSLLRIEVADKPQFIQDYLLATLLFVVIEKDRIITGQCGDGVIIKNRIPEVIDQDGKPSYMAYENVPREMLKCEPSKLDYIKITEVQDCDSIVIASDGLTPIIGTDKEVELYGNIKRQLQRKFNVWQMRDRVFSDDVSCIVFEKEPK
jgi:serine/threonine protein phosphatase PrpC